jgi:AMP phosphorylase
MAYYLKCKKIDITSGGGLEALLNAKEADSYGIRPGDRVSIIWNKKKRTVVSIDLSDKEVKPGEIGLYKNVWQEHETKSGEVIEVKLEGRPLSIETIKKKMRGEPATYEEFYAVMKDIVDGKLGEVETAYFAASGLLKPYSDMELYYMTKAMVETGDKFNMRIKVADKHSVGGLAGNRITPIVIPIVASLGIYIPKTSSRAITSPSGTADTMEVLCPVNFTLMDVQKIIRKTKGCLIWGGGLSLAPADDKLIRVSRPLAIDPFDKMVVSIMAKKVATGVDCLIIDMPVGESCKIPNMKVANDLAKKFVFIGKKFGMKVKVVATPAKQPVGRGIGPALEARDVLRVLQQHKYRPLDLERKSIKLAGALIELKGYCRKGKGAAIARQQIKSGAAWKKMNEILVAQGGQNDWNSEEVMKEIQKYEIHSPKNGRIVRFDNKAINEVCMNLGAPLDKYAGIHMHVNFGDKVTKGQKLFTMYTSNQERLNLGVIAAEKNIIYYVK